MAQIDLYLQYFSGNSYPTIGEILFTNNEPESFKEEIIGIPSKVRQGAR